MAVLQEEESTASVTADLPLHNGSGTGSEWLLDSGASLNFTPHLSDLMEGVRPCRIKTVRVADGELLPVHGVGEVLVLGVGGQRIWITGVHWVPDMHSRLLSVSHFTRKGGTVTFDRDHCRVGKGGELHLEGRITTTGLRGLYCLDLPLAWVGLPWEEAQGPPPTVFEAAVTLETAHRRLIHTAPSTLMDMARQGSVTGLELEDFTSGHDCSSCEVCQEVKSKRLPFPPVTKTPVTQPLEVVSADLFGPLRVPTVGKGSQYILSLIDHYTSYTWCYQTVNKAAATLLAVMQQWLAEAERQAGTQLKTLRTDNGTEFQGEVGEWVREKGIQRQLTAPYSPQQNGKVERWHQTMRAGISSVLVSSGAPTNLWGEGLRHVVHVKNRLPHKALKKGLTPYQAWTGHKPDLRMLRVWGCMATSHLPPTAVQGKLARRGKPVINLGVDDQSKAWRVLDPATGRVEINRNVQFNENLMWKDWAAEHQAEVAIEVSTRAEVEDLLPEEGTHKVFLPTGVPPAAPQTGPTRDGDEPQEEGPHPILRRPGLRSEGERKAVSFSSPLEKGPTGGTVKWASQEDI